MSVVPFACGGDGNKRVFVVEVSDDTKSPSSLKTTFVVMVDTSSTMVVTVVNESGCDIVVIDFEDDDEVMDEEEEDDDEKDGGGEGNTGPSSVPCFVLARKFASSESEKSDSALENSCCKRTNFSSCKARKYRCKKRHSSL